MKGVFSLLPQLAPCPPSILLPPSPDLYCLPGWLLAKRRRSKFWVIKPLVIYIKSPLASCSGESKD